MERWTQKEKEEEKALLKAQLEREKHMELQARFKAAQERCVSLAAMAELARVKQSQLELKHQALQETHQALKAEVELASKALKNKVLEHQALQETLQAEVAEANKALKNKVIEHQLLQADHAMLKKRHVDLSKKFGLLDGQHADLKAHWGDLARENERLASLSLSLGRREKSLAGDLMMAVSAPKVNPNHKEMLQDAFDILRAANRSDDLVTIKGALKRASGKLLSLQWGLLQDAQ